MERGYVFVRSSISMCPQCKQTVPAKIINRNNQLFLLKNCPTHGPREDLYEENAQWCELRSKFDKPGDAIIADTKIAKGCPYDCGLCPDHEQHSCIALIEVTNACDLCCPTCYANSGTGKYLQYETIVQMIDRWHKQEGGEAQILQISGGEPTLHPRIIDIIAYARTKAKHVMLNTNGLRLARDEALVKALATFGDRFEVYLQFDGFKASTYERLRGKNILEEKKKVLALFAKYHVPCTLVATIEAGVNDDDIGEIVLFGMEQPAVRGINFQPVAQFGRHDAINKRITLTGVLDKIEIQAKGALRRDDFVPLPCNVHSVAIAFLMRKNGRYIPLAREFPLEKYAKSVRNTLQFDADDLLSGAGCNCAPFVQRLGGLIPGTFLSKTPEQKAAYITENVFRVTVTSFIDAYNFEMTAVKKECVHILTIDGKRIPFSMYNLIHRDKKCNFN